MQFSVGSLVEVFEATSFSVFVAGTYSHHPFWKEHDLNQTSRDDMFQPFIFRGVSDCGSILPVYTCHYGNRRLDQSRNIFAGKDGDFGDGKLDLPKKVEQHLHPTLTVSFFLKKGQPMPQRPCANLVETMVVHPKPRVYPLDVCFFFRKPFCSKITTPPVSTATEVQKPLDLWTRGGTGWTPPDGLFDGSLGFLWLAICRWIRVKPGRKWEERNALMSWISVCLIQKGYYLKVSISLHVLGVPGEKNGIDMELYKWIRGCLVPSEFFLSRNHHFLQSHFYVSFIHYWWWFETFLICTSTWGDDPIWL